MKVIRPGAEVTVVGGGLAGLSVARALVRDGCAVTLHEGGSEVASGASGNPAGIFKPILSRTATAQSRLSFLALPALREEIKRLAGEGVEIEHGLQGLIQLARDAEEERRFQDALLSRALPETEARWLSADAASRRLDWNVPFGGVDWRGGGWVSPHDLCRAWSAELSRASRFRLVLNSEFPLDTREWRSRGGASAAVVLCAGPATRALPEFERFPYQLIRGQLSEVSLPGEVSPELPVSFHEYLIPMGSGRFLIGATHDRGEDSTEVRPADHERLLRRFGEMLPDRWKSRPELTEPTRLRAGVRFTSQSRLPYLGMLPITSETAGLPVYCFSALGSRGILWAPLLADALAAWMQGKAAAIDHDLELRKQLQALPASM